MFNLEYIAANCGSDITNGGDVFITEELHAEGNTVTLSKTPVPVVSGGAVNVYHRLASKGGDDMTPVVAEGNTITVETPDVDYCVMYRYTDEAAKQITINAQFIPSTLHAVLTVALYLGDACDVTAATKAGEVEIDIPRFQLTGAMDITMNATGAAQTPLEGNALASGCTGCDGDGVYATITKVLFNANWYDDAQGIILENATRTVKSGKVNETFRVYAYYNSGAPKLVNPADITWSIEAGDTTLAVDGGVVSAGSAVAGKAIVTAKVTAKQELAAVGSVTVE